MSSERALSVLGLSLLVAAVAKLRLRPRRLTALARADGGSRALRKTPRRLTQVESGRKGLGRLTYPHGARVCRQEVGTDWATGGATALRAVGSHMRKLNLAGIDRRGIGLLDIGCKLCQYR